MSSTNVATEKSELIAKPTCNGSSTQCKASKSFIIGESLEHEIKLIIQRTALMTLQMLCQLGSPVVALIFVGQLPDDVIYLSAVGLSRTFVNVTGTAMAWGFTTSLFTLLPQAIGAGQTKLASIHIQRAFYVVTIVSCFLSITQFFAGDIMIALGQPQELGPLINKYCRLLIPYIFLITYTSILMRLLQALDLNVGLTYGCLIMFTSTPLFVWLFMYPFGMGYLGAAMGQNMALLMFCISMFIYLVYKGMIHNIIHLMINNDKICRIWCNVYPSSIEHSMDKKRYDTLYKFGNTWIISKCISMDNRRNSCIISWIYHTTNNSNKYHCDFS